MQNALRLTRTTVGQKAIIAVTGLVMFGFLIGHLAGNLLIFVGPEAINSYAETLHNTPALLWGTRIVLLTAVVAHITLTLKIARRNSAARPRAYRSPKKDLLTSYAAKTMVLSGPIILFYILFHLAHLTVGTGFGQYDHTALGMVDGTLVGPYENVVRSFQVWWISGIYIFANLLIGLHLYHGVWSALQSLGASHPQYDALRQRAATGVALAITGGNIAIPIAVMTGIVG